MDKRTLELAAKAAGRTLTWSEDGTMCWLDRELDGSPNNDDPWCPDGDYGDFARLAKAIGATVDFKNGEVFLEYSPYSRNYIFTSECDDSIQEALVHLAARIGEAME